MDQPSVTITIEIEQDVLEAFAYGEPGWQARIASALRRASGLGKPHAGADDGMRPEELNAANDD